MSTIPSSEIKCSVSLGKGGFGEVWKATWSGQGGGEIVAVKKIPISGKIILLFFFSLSSGLGKNLLMFIYFKNY